jgi:hypothetical protein
MFFSVFFAIMHKTSVRDNRARIELAAGGQRRVVIGGTRDCSRHGLPGLALAAVLSEINDRPSVGCEFCRCRMCRTLGPKKGRVRGVQ